MNQIGKNNKKPKTCQHCHGTHSVLTNSKGNLKTSLCRCFQCELCNGDGRCFEEDDLGRSIVTECACTEFKRRLHLLNEAGIPGKFLTSTFETFQGSSKKSEMSKNFAKTVAMEFVKNYGKNNRGLVFTGGPGTGKTHLAISTVKSLILDKGVDCKFVDFFQLLADIRHGYSKDVSEQTLIQPYAQSKVLVIDELAKGRNTEWELTILDQVISNRYNTADKITLFTTNFMQDKPKSQTEHSKIDTNRSGFADMFTQETLEDRVGPRIYSRMLETCEFLKLEGKDYRQIHKKVHHL